jgi:hypothetical protein
MLYDGVDSTGRLVSAYFLSSRILSHSTREFYADNLELFTNDIFANDFWAFEFFPLFAVEVGF